MKTFVNQAAQGDILITRIANLPNKVSLVKWQKLAIIAHSESGHSHVMDADKVDMYRLPEEIYECFLVVKETATLEHLRPFDTHESIAFEPGIYRVNRQREYTPQGMRRVED